MVSDEVGLIIVLIAAIIGILGYVRDDLALVILGPVIIIATWIFIMWQDEQRRKR